MTLNIVLLSSAVCLAIGMASGYGIGKLKGERDELELRDTYNTQTIERQNESINKVSSNLQTLADISENSLKEAQRIAVRSAEITNTASQRAEESARRTQELNYEIAKLDANCVFNPDYRVLLKGITERANSSRYLLYPGQTVPADTD